MFTECQAPPAAQHEALEANRARVTDPAIEARRRAVLHVGATPVVPAANPFATRCLRRPSPSSLRVDTST